jgi:hypothetical protein
VVVPPAVHRGTTVPPVRSSGVRPTILRTALLPLPTRGTGAPATIARALVPAAAALRTALLPFPAGTPSACTAVGGAVVSAAAALRAALLPLPARAATRAALALRTTVPPVLPRRAFGSAAALRTTLGSVPVGTSFLPASTPSIIRASAGGTASLPRTLPATACDVPAGTGTSLLRTPLPGAAAASSGCLSAVPAGASSR